jgi:hypothetical protein
MVSQFEQRLFFLVYCGSARPKEIFFGVLPELIGL